MIGAIRTSETSFYSDQRAVADLVHDQLLLQMHTDFALAPVWAHRLGMVTKPLPIPSWTDIVEHVNRHDYLKHSSVESYQRELYSAITRRYGQTLHKWCTETVKCTRCARSFRWLTSIGQWKCRYHYGVPLDGTHLKWSCCAHRLDIPLSHRFYGCLRADHTTLERASATQAVPDAVRMPLALMDKLNVRVEALMPDCLVPWTMGTDTAIAPEPCLVSHMLATEMFALDDAARQVSVPFPSNNDVHDIPPTLARERCCMISLFESPLAEGQRQILALARQRARQPSTLL